MKIRILLKHGHTIDVECDNYEFTRSKLANEGYTKYSFTGLNPKKNFGFNLHDMVGWERIK